MGNEIVLDGKMILREDLKRKSEKVGEYTREILLSLTLELKMISWLEANHDKEGICWSESKLR